MKKLDFICPVCGGRLLVCWFETGSTDYLVSKTGKPHKNPIRRASTNLGPIEDARLMERSFGNSEGLTKAEIHELEVEHPEITDIWNYKRNVGYNGIEPFQEFAKRIYEFLTPYIHSLPASWVWVLCTCVLCGATVFILKKIPGVKKYI